MSKSALKWVDGWLHKYSVSICKASRKFEALQGDMSNFEWQQLFDTGIFWPISKDFIQSRLQHVFVTRHSDQCRLPGLLARSFREYDVRTVALEGRNTLLQLESTVTTYLALPGSPCALTKTIWISETLRWQICLVYGFAGAYERNLTTK